MDVRRSEGAPSVNRICGLLHQGYRGLRLYPMDHPSARQIMDALMDSLGAYLNASGPLVLEVEEERLLCEGEQVYTFTGSRDNLAFLLYRDGIRSVSFSPGLESTELDTFVNYLTRADDLTALEHDLATAFWEEDFVHIDYQVADPFLGGEVLREGTVEVLRETVLRRLDEAALIDGSSSQVPADLLSPVAPLGLDPEALALSQAEIEVGERIVTETSDVLKDFVVVLLELAADESSLGNATGPSDSDTPLLRSLAGVVDHYLQAGDHVALRDLVVRLRSLEETGRRPAGLVDAVIGAALTPERLGFLLERSLEAKGDEAGCGEQFLVSILPGALPVVLELLVETENRAVRKTLLTLLEGQGGVPGRLVWPLMHDPRWYVARNAVRLMVGSTEPELPARLEQMLRHVDARVRREVVRTLDSLEGSRPVVALLKALDDEDSSVRTLAAQSLGHHGGLEQQAALEARVLSGSFDSCPEEEVEAFTFALAALGGEAAIRVLDALWRRRHLKARAPQVRVAALQALGTISSPTTVSILTEAARSREAPVRQAAEWVLRRATSFDRERQP